MSGTTTGGTATSADEKRRMLAELLKRRAATPKTHPASIAQKRLWFIAQLEPESPSYNVPTAWTVRGPLDLDALRRSLADLHRRHESLRTRFAVVDDEPVQVVDPPADEVPLDVVELEGDDDEARDADFDRRLRALTLEAMDLARGPLVRWRLYRLSPTEHRLALVFHHAVFDGWSTVVVDGDLTKLYAAHAAGRAPDLKPVALQYADFVAWQRAHMNDDEVARQLAFWSERLRGMPPLLDLPLDRPRPPTAGPEAITVSRTVKWNEGGDFQSLLRAEQATPFMGALALYAAVLSRYAGQDRLVVGTPVLGRTRQELEKVVGYFANTLAIPVDLSGNPSFREALRRVRETLLAAYANQDLPFDRLVDELKVPRSLQHAPVYQVMIASRGRAVSAPGEAERKAEEATREKPALTVVEFEGRLTEVPVASADLNLRVAETDDGYHLEAEYRTEIFDHGTAERLLDHVTALLAGVAARPDLPLASHPLLTDEERVQVLEGWNATETAYPSDSTIHALFEARAAETPDAVALVSETASLTYGDLNARANRLAHWLRGQGVGPDARVAVCLERGAEMVTALLAVLKAGGAYVPLDPGFPEDRLRYMLRDSAPVALLTQSSLSGLFAGEEAAVAPTYLDGADAPWAEMPETDVGDTGTRPHHLAYVIYTSGSTGLPKGVMVQHGGVVNLLWSMREIVGVSVADRVLALTTVAFDIAVLELFLPLVTGAATLVIGRETSADPARLEAAVSEMGATVMQATPATWRMLVDHGWAGRPGLRALCGGEALPAELAARLVGRVGTLLNVYGPTETTIWSSTHTVTAADGTARPNVVIGRPIANTRMYVLDAAGLPVPVGVSGELFIGGDGVARGYFRRPDLTSERFVADPFSSVQGARMYRTGDLVRRLADGSLEYLGRNDFQVKVRGFRIELGEIESRLAAHPAVRAAVVTARDDGAGDRRLVAYVVGADDVDADALRTHLRGGLPEYMVPSAFVRLQEFPLTPNGKVDRRALPAPEIGNDVAKYVAPRTPTEEVLAAIWGEVLKVERVGAHDGFFELGGHSLLATRMISRIRQGLEVELPLRSVFEAPTLAELAHRVDAAARGGQQAPPLVPVPREGALPASFAQERLWFVDRLVPGSAAYNLPLVLTMPDVAPDVAARAVAEIAARHESLRTTFATVDGQVVQVVHPAGDVPFEVVDLTTLPEEEQAAAVDARMQAEVARPFDLERGPLFRATLVRGGPTVQVLVLAMHHVVSDGWSLGVLSREVEALCRAFAAGQPSPLPALPVQYADFAAWQRQYLSGDVLAGQLAYWKAQLAGAPPVLELPTDRPRPPVETNRGAVRWFRVPSALARRMRALARGEGATLFMTLLAAFDVLLSRWTGQDDLVVGSPIAGRTRAEIEPLIGFFVNNLALRTDLSGDVSFRRLVGRVREVTLGAYAHQDLPFEKLVEELNVPRALSHSPVFQVLFALQNAGGLPFPHDAPEDTVTLPERTARPAKFDLSLEFNEIGEWLLGSLEYATDLFDDATADRMADQLVRLMEALVAEPDAPVSAHVLADGAERETLARFGRGPAANVADGTIARRFARVAAETPDAVAVESAEETLTYARLDARASRLARHLRAKGVRGGDRVALAAERSADTVVALLAIAKAGGAYVPLDPAYPAERLAFMLEDSAASLLLVADEVPASLSAFAGPVVSLARDAAEIAGRDASPYAEEVAPESPAYVVYTSGSTGRPKGVAVPQRAVLRLAVDGGFARMDAGETFLQLAPVAFDASTLEVWGPLLNGARLVVFPAGTPSLEELGAFVRDRGVTILWLTAGLFHQMVDGPVETLRGVRQLLAGGDALSVPHVRRALEALPDTVLINGYGPTESTTFTTTHRISPADGERASIPIGRPIAGTVLHVLDEGMRPVPVDVPGELYIGGDGLALGYLNAPALTAERFVADPFSADPAARLYRSGDRVRWLDGGALEFLGRIDGQVKVRGFRIELGEIESALRALPGVRDAAVVVRDVAGDKRLAAYVVGEAETSALRAALRTRLPDYMVPATVTALETIPLTPNGKVDRRALPAPAEEGDGAGFVAPRTATETALAEIWREVLGRERVGVEDDFFALGGHSLLATRVVSRVREAFRVELPLRALFEAPTVAGLAARVDSERPSDAAPPIVRVSRDAPLPLSFAQERLWFFDRLVPGTSVYNVPVVSAVAGLDPAVLEAALGELVRRHESLRTTFAEVDDRAVQIVHPAGPFTLNRVDLSHLPEAERAAEAQRVIDAESNRPFDLQAGPLFRAMLVEAGDAQVLVLVMHHIVSDGWSMDVLQREVDALYRAFAAGEPSPLAPLDLQYPDFAVWQRSHLSGAVLDAQLAYWKEKLEGAPALLELPTDRPRPALQTFVGSTQSMAIPPRAGEALTALARAEGATPFMALLAAFSVLLSRYAGQRDVVVGSPIAGRNRVETEGMIGFFVNTLVLRADLSAEPTFRQLLAQVRETTLGAYAHQDVPFEKLVEELKVERSLSHSPLFQVMFALQNATAVGAADLDAMAEGGEVTGGLAASRFDLTVNVFESGGGFGGTLEYNTDLFDASTMRRLGRHFAALVEAAAAEPDVPVTALPLLPAEERREMLEGYDGPRIDVPRSLLHALFEARAAERPDAVALVHDGRETAYGALNARANRIAHHLRALGVGPETLVGVCMERTPDLVASLLGVLKSGGAYVPLDPAYPAERIGAMVDDARAAVVLTQSSLAAALPATGAAVVLVDADDALAARPETDPAHVATDGNTAYVIFTSGSTGRPKGVQIEHRSAVTLMHWFRGEMSDDELGGMLGATSVSFDVSVAEIFGTLSWGGRLVLVENALSLPAVADQGVRVASMVPSAAAELLRMGGIPAGVRAFNLGGEALPAAVADGLHALGTVETVRNLWGPTEDTTYSTMAIVPAGGGRVRIGRPTANTRAMVLDARLEPVPVGVAGEIWLAGEGLARGYLGRPALTAERWLPNPHGAPGSRMYRVGDVGRRLADGELDYLGRTDHQVKVRGFRIELGEIEAVLRAHPSVDSAVVVVREDHPGDRRIVGYVTPADGDAATISADALKAHLKGALPGHMVPSALVALEALPLSPNGKVDRRALPAPEGAVAAAAYVAPRTPDEDALAAIWAGVLRVERVGVEDDFFELGGHSLLATQVVARIRGTMGVDVPLRAMFEAPTVAALAARVGAARDAARQAPAAPKLGAASREGRRMTRTVGGDGSSTLKGGG